MLPEMWNCPYSNASFPTYAEDIDAGPGASPSTAMLAEVAAAKRVTIIGGSHSGALARQALQYLLRVHLFDIDIPGKITFKESETLTGGSNLTVVDTELGLRVGLGICYDIRFPEMAMLYANRGAFNMTTGPAHWELLAKASKILVDIFIMAKGLLLTAQFYVALCSPARDDKSSYIAWGHSIVTGPFAETVAAAEHEETTIYAEIDVNEIKTRRMNMPIDTQRRGDMYELVDHGAE
eukprot:SM000115S23935  [mRNA]  locus=s115:336733:339141:+ [translate_table: standard]